MFGIGKKRVSTESYKGVRDFYPEDQSVQNYIFGVMRQVVESWGYLEYGASILEPLELYEAKSSDEIVREQIYSFTDRGDRRVVLRPEMTPTVARLVAGRVQELPSPIRWYSIANFFRYEKPQRGRYREFWQLNVDMFGVKSLFAEVEVITIASQIMKKFGAKDVDFQIKISSRTLLDDIFKKIKIEEDKRVFVYRLIDKKEKMPAEEFKNALTTLIGEESAKALLENLYFGEGILSMMPESQGAKELNQVLNTLRENGVTNVVFEPTMTRGFDYYTGIVFEVFDTNKENNRSLFGGGRYDNLVGSFTNQAVPAFGFGMGDVTVRDFILTHDLMPKLASTTKLYICVAPETDLKAVYILSEKFRNNGINTAVDVSGKKLADQLKSLAKRQIPYVVTLGSEELQNQNFTIRNTETREEKSGTLDEVVNFLKNI
jgi:histidyl-tRNA synthetase